MLVQNSLDKWLSPNTQTQILNTPKKIFYLKWEGEKPDKILWLDKMPKSEEYNFIQKIKYNLFYLYFEDF